MTDRDLVERFVATFEVLDERVLTHRELAEPHWSGDIGPLVVPPPDPDDWPEWIPIPDNLPRDALQHLYHRLPGPLPPLYEELILSWRWAEVEVSRFRLIANLPPGLEGLITGITTDSTLLEALAPAGFVQFGKGSDIDYDPVCFDLGSRESDGDCRVVKFDHEEILCNRRLVEVRTLAPTFRRLMETVIQDAADALRRR